MAVSVPAVAGGTPHTQSSLTAGVESSDVRIGARNDTWRSYWMQWNRRTADSGLFAAINRLTRSTGSGRLATLGGHWLGEHWVVSGQVEAGSGAAFIPHKAAEVHAGLRLGPTHVVRIGYRQADYRGSTLRLWSVAGLLYHGDGEWELGYHRGELDMPAPQRIAFGLLRGLWTCGPRWTCGVRLAAGRNVFGADEPGFDTGTGWQAGTFVAYHFTSADSLRFDLGTGHGNRFRQNTLSVSYRHAFRR